MRRFFALFTVWLSAFSVWAVSPLNDGGITNNATDIVWTNDLTIVVGLTTNNSGLIIEGDFSKVSNRNTDVGVQAGASNAFVQVKDASAWQMSGDFRIGVTGSNARVVIEDTADVLAQNIRVGATSDSGGNTVLVDGTGTTLQASNTIYVGVSGNSGNSVTVTNGAWVAAQTIQVADGNDFNLNRGGGLLVDSLNAGQEGFNWNSGSDLVVTGTLSGINTILDSEKELFLEDAAQWSAPNAISVAGISNRVWVLEASRVSSAGLSVSGVSNLVAVSGSNSQWNSSAGITVGGVSNYVEISNGAEVLATSLTLGEAGATQNVVRITGGDTVWSNRNEVVVGGLGVTNTLQIDSGASLYSSIGTVGGGGVSNTVRVAANGSWFVREGSLSVTNTGNLLKVDSGGRVFVGDAAEGGDFDSGYGAIIVAATDSNAVLSVDTGGRIDSDLVRVGVEASNAAGRVEINDDGTLAALAVFVEEGSELNLNAGGTLEMRGAFDAGMDHFNWNSGGELRMKAELVGMAQSNVVEDLHEYTYVQLDGGRILTLDEGGEWNQSANRVAVGWTGENNQLIITNGGQAGAHHFYLGYGSDNNSATITGSNSALTVNETLYVGYNGTEDNVMTVANAGTVSAENLVIEDDNELIIEEGGNLEIRKDFDVAEAANLTWETGELTVKGRLTWSEDLDGSGQILTLQGEDALWTNRAAAQLVVGTVNTGSELRVLDGALVSNATAIVGQSDSSVSNRVLVSGADSLWTLTGGLTIGNDANSNNTVTVKDGGTVSLSALNVADDNAFNLNNGGRLETRNIFDASVDGFNWNSGGTLATYGGLTGLNIADGTNRILHVEGGTVGASGDVLYWGNEGFGNQMVVNTGAVLASDAFIGNGRDADKNQVTLSGRDSAWTNTGDLVVGVYGAQNSLYVGTSGTVVSVNAFIGQERSATENKVTVEGSNATFEVGQNLYVGAYAAGNSLKVADGGQVDAGRLFVGAVADDNEVSVSGEDATLSASSLFVGASYVPGNVTVEGVVVPHASGASELTRGNKLTVSDGGRVETEQLKITEGNDFYLLNGGTLHVEADEFNITNTQYEGLHWNAGGNLSLSGELLGMAITNLAVADETTNTFGFLNGGRYLTLDGSSATWTNDNLILGYKGGGTKLTLSDGARISQTNTYIGWETSGGNAVVVENSSVMTNLGNLYVGRYRHASGDLKNTGADNSLSVSNGGWVLVGDGAAALVGSRTGGIAVSSTNGAELLVSSGSHVLTEQGLYVGENALSTGTVSVADGGSVTVSNLVISGGSAFNLNQDGKLFVTGDFDYALQTNVNWNEGGHLAVGGELTELTGLLESKRTLSLDGSNAVWNLGANELVIGSEGTGNRLNILNGATVTTTTNAFVGQNALSHRNAVEVSGSNSIWNVQQELKIGFRSGEQSSVGNWVAVMDNGLVMADTLNIATNNYFFLEEDGTLEMQGAFNLAEDKHQGLIWESGGTLAVRGVLSGMATTNLVVDGITNTHHYLGGGKRLTLDGNGAGWNVNDDHLIVGFADSNSKLLVTNGATVNNADGFIGWGSKKKDNTVVVSGAGSSWTNDNLYIGTYFDAEGERKLTGSGNSLTVENGAWVNVGDATTNIPSGGILVAGSDGAELVVGSGSVNVNGLYIGSGANAGTVDLLKGGKITLETLGIAAGYGTLNLEGTLQAASNITLNVGQDGFNWLDGGDIVLDGSHLTGVSAMSGSNKTVTITDGSWSNSTQELVLSGYKNAITVSSTTNNVVNGQLTSAGAKIGTNSTDFGNAITLSEANTVWDNSGALYVGHSGSGNTLTIKDGAEVNNADAFVGFAASASNNTVTVSGTNSAWNILGNLSIGASGSNNVLNIAEQALVDVTGSLELRNGSELNLLSTNFTVGANVAVYDSVIAGTNWIAMGTGESAEELIIQGRGSVVEARFDASGGSDRIEVSNAYFFVNGDIQDKYKNFEELELKDSTLYGAGTLFGIPNRVLVDGGEIIPQGELRVGTGFAVTNQPLLRVGAGVGYLSLAGGIDLQELDAEVIIPPGEQNFANYAPKILEADRGVINEFASSEIIEDYLFYTFDLAYSNKEVLVEAELVPDGALRGTLSYVSAEGVRSGFNAMKNSVFIRTKQLRRNLVATSHAISREAYLLSTPDAPEGPKGPGDQNTIADFNIWVQQFSTEGDYDRTAASDGVRMNNNGTTIGFDKLIGESVVAGVNYTYSRTHARSENNDRMDTETYWVGGYGEWVSDNGLYVDALAGYGFSTYNSERRDSAYLGTARYDGYAFGSNLDVGQYYHYKKLALSPYVGLHYLGLGGDSHDEKSDDQGDIRIDDFEHAWLESVFGLKLRQRIDSRIGRFQLTGYAEWAHDFLQDDSYSSLSAGQSSVDTARVSPDEDVFSAGVGGSWIFTDSLEIGFGYNGRYSENYEEHSASAIINLMF